MAQPALPPSPVSPGADRAAVTTPAQDATLLERALFEVKRVIVGQDRMIERMFVALLARGHCLLEGVPGVAKTLAVETLAKVVGGSFARVQFTPDLVPADIVGTRIYRSSSEKFDIELGPVFVNFLLADEINRAPAKVQSALLEVMAEQKVSIGGQTYEVPRPFLVMATQNPIEQEGVYPLPEAQRDRFLMKIQVGYPTDAEEREIVARRQDGGSIRLTVRAPKALMPFIAPKGSITLDGISLTVNEVGDETFGVNIIPITQEVTNLGSNGMGVPVNLEIDQVARYVARLLGKDAL